MIRKVEIGNHLGSKHAGYIRSRRYSAARGNLLGHATASDNFPTFEHEGGETCPRQVRRGRQPVVAGTDDNRVVNRMELLPMILTYGHDTSFKA
jgi:hypothetical protein